MHRLRGSAVGGCDSPWGVLRVRDAALVAGAAAFTVLAVAAGKAEAILSPGGDQAWLVPVVGLVIASSAVAMRDPILGRLLLAATGVAWLAGSFSVWLLILHQGVLLVALVAAGTGRIVGMDRLVVVAAVPVSLGVFGQPVVGACFFAVACVVLSRSRTPIAFAAGIAASVVGTLLVGSWAASRVDPAGFDPRVALLAYEAALMVAGGALVAGSAAVAARDGSLVDRLVAGPVGGSDVSGLSALAVTLADVMRAPGLVIEPVNGLASGRPQELRVSGDGRDIAVVRHPVVTSLRPATRDAVAAAVRLVAEGDRRRAALSAQLDALEAAQRRLLSVRDAQQETTARRLRSDVIEPLRRATSLLLTDDVLGDPEVGSDGPVDPVAADSVAVAVGQIRSAVDDLEDLVRGAGPAALGVGRLRRAVEEIAELSPLSVDLRVTGAVDAPEAVEKVLYYVCAEALVNVHRHAGTRRAVVRLAAERGLLRLVVIDTGHGDADPQGSGLSGLRARVAAAGGRLQVVSPPGVGTTVVAEFPMPDLDSGGGAGG